ncbi:MAG: hypothetical protein AAGE76_05810 [Pseudomonadota bacterium]
MELIADGLLIAGALTAALYCWVLARRLRALRNMDKGLGGAIAGLSERVEQTKASLADTKASTRDISKELSELTARAEIAAGRLELLLSTLHDSPKSDTPVPRAEPEAPAEPEVAASAPAREPQREIVTALRRIAEGGAR